MSLEFLAPWLLLAASFAAALSGLLVHSQVPHDITQPVSKPGDASKNYRKMANALFVLSLVMLAWAGLWVLGPYAATIAGDTGRKAHHFLVPFVAVITGLASYWGKKRKRDGRR